MSDRQTAQDIAEEAARWVWRLESGERTDVVQAQLAGWLDGDVRRRGALLQAEAAWVALDLTGQDIAEQPVPSANDRDGHPDHRLWRSRRSMLTGLGGIAAALVAGVYLTGRPAERYETAIGEVRRVPLADRSTMAVNTASRVTVAYADTRRAVSLEQGEAWFQVAKDKTKPFVVSAGPIRVEAVGTSFSVRRRDEGADVMVTEGVVRVWVEGDEARAVRLGAGSALFVSDDAGIRPEPTAGSGIERKLAWRAGRLDLAGETLSEAAVEFNRYSLTPIVIRDRAVADKRLYGTFRLDDPQGFARTAAVALGVAAWQEDKRIVIAATRY